MKNRENNYQKQQENARHEFMKFDQNNIIKRFNAEYNDQLIFIDFYSSKYEIVRKTGEVFLSADKSPADFEAVMTIYDILCFSKTEAKLSGQWKTLANLSPHSNFGSSGREMYAEDSKHFNGRLTEIKEACVRLGGFRTTKADAGYRFDVFNFLPIVFQFWEGDEEFNPRINFLFDANTLDFIHFETAWYAAGYLLNLIKKELQFSD